MSIIKILGGIGLAVTVTLGAAACGSSSHKSTAQVVKVPAPKPAPAPAPNFAPLNGTYQGDTGDQGVLTLKNGIGHYVAPDHTACPSCSTATAPMGSLDFQLNAMTSDGLRAGGTVTQTSDAAWAKEMFAGVGTSMSLQDINGSVTVSFLPGITLRNQAAQDAESKAAQANNSSSNDNQQPQQPPTQYVPTPQPAPQPQYVPPTPAQQVTPPYNCSTYNCSNIQPNGGSGDTGAASNDPTDNGPSYSPAPSYSNEGAPSYSSGGIQSNGGSGDTGAAGDDPTDNG